MKKTIKAVVPLLSILILLTGCQAGGSATKDETTLYPITIDGYEIVVGQTTAQTLLDAGLAITMPSTDADGQTQQYDVDGAAELEKNSYYRGCLVWFTEDMYATIALVTENKAIPMSEAVIAFFSIDLIYGNANELERFAFNGVPVSELGREKATELLPKFEGDDMIRHDYTNEHSCQISFNAAGTGLDAFSVQKTYNVDWDSEN